MGGSGGHRRLPGGSDDFSWHTYRQTLHHNIYIVIIMACAEGDLHHQPLLSQLFDQLIIFPNTLIRSMIFHQHFEGHLLHLNHCKYFQCTLEKKTVKKVSPDTSCRKIPRYQSDWFSNIYFHYLWTLFNFSERYARHRIVKFVQQRRLIEKYLAVFKYSSIQQFSSIQVFKYLRPNVTAGLPRWATGLDPEHPDGGL